MLHAQSNGEMRGDAAAEDLIYHITHDLRAPLRALSVLPDWIEEDIHDNGDVVPAAISEHLDTIRAQTKALDQMILDLRDFSRVGRLADPTRDVDLQKIIQDLTGDLGCNPEISLTLELDVRAIRAPANDLNMLFKNLITNASQHHDRDHANVTISSEQQADCVQIAVSDDGPGIAPDQRERAFEILTTLYRREEGAGSGMGLAIAKRVVENLNGHIEIADNTAGRGTTIQITLPAAAIQHPISATSATESDR